MTEAPASPEAPEPPSPLPDSVAPESGSPSSAEIAEPEAEVELLTEPSDGVPDIVLDEVALAEVVAVLRAGSGPLAIDAERAHGFRYSQRAYLIQVRRAGSGTHLIDPLAFSTPGADGRIEPPNFADLNAALADCEWIIHAASQDLACLAEIGLLPQRLFDTELAARLLGYPRVALGTMIEELFGVRLLKEHSASDWSTRPLPREWLTYAALDVELLIPLRDQLADQLVAAGKWEWAEQEFAALAAGAGRTPEPRVDPWRRTSGIHRVRTRRGLGYVAALWRTRDEIARRLDRAPGKILPDAAITELAQHGTPGRTAIRQIATFSRRQARRYETTWVDAVTAVDQLTERELPPLHLPHDGPPQPRLWAAKDPVAAARLAKIRASLTGRAAELDLPMENLLTPEFVRRLAWRPPTPATAESIDAFLAELGARPWQRELTVDLFLAALASD